MVETYVLADKWAMFDDVAENLKTSVGINLTVGCLHFAPEHVRQEDTHAKDPPPSLHHLSRTQGVFKLLMHLIDTVPLRALQTTALMKTALMQHDSVNCEGTKYTTANTISPGIC